MAGLGNGDGTNGSNLGNNSLSEPNLTTAGKPQINSGFPPGTTVDELWLYRRKKPSGNLWSNDNLKPEAGSFKLIKSEYKRRFKNFYEFGGSCNELSSRPIKPEDTLKVEGLFEFHPEYNESFVEYPIEKPARSKPQSNSFQIIDSHVMDENSSKEISRILEPLSTEKSSKYIKYSETERPHIIKRPTNLKIEGDFYSVTEKAEKFIEFLLTKRPDLARKPTTLKLEGDMETKTENKEKFIPYEHQTRPPLCKKFTNLHLEGDLNIITEKQDKFIPYEIQKRPPLNKMNTNLHIEGDLQMIPEYRREYIEYKDLERRKLVLPIDNLKTDGFYELSSTISKPFQDQIHPAIPFLRQSDKMQIDTFPVRRRDSHMKLEGQTDAVSESKTQFIPKPVFKSEIRKAPSNLQLEGRIDMNPEYRNAYIDFQSDRKLSPARESRRWSQRNNLKPEGKMEISPEYSCSYVDFPRERPRIRKPDCSLSSEGEVDHITENNEKYIFYPNNPRTESLKRDSELKLDGRFECQPEYRKAYIDYLIREKVDRKQRPTDNLGVPTKRAFEVMSSVEISKIEKEKLPFGDPQLASQDLSTDSDLPPKKNLSRASSVRSSTSSLSRSPRNKSLRHRESSVFGPKLTVPVPQRKSSRASSRSASPAISTKTKSAKSKNRELSPNSTTTDSDVSSRRNRVFGNSVRVENLAGKTSPYLPPMINTSARNKWMKDSSVESSSSFVILEKEVNNNNYMKSDRNKRPSSSDVYYKEQRWVPSWYDAPPIP